MSVWVSVLTPVASLSPPVQVRGLGSEPEESLQKLVRSEFDVMRPLPESFPFSVLFTLRHFFRVEN